MKNFLTKQIYSDTIEIGSYKFYKELIDYWLDFSRKDEDVYEFMFSDIQNNLKLTKEKIKSIER